jgi:hypothetical protein
MERLEPVPFDFEVVSVVYLPTSEALIERLTTSKQGVIVESKAKKLSPLQILAEELPDIFRDYVLGYLKNQVQPPALKKNCPFYPSHHIARVAMLNRDFHDLITEMFSPLSFEDFSLFMSINNAIEMFYEVPECISPKKMAKFSMFNQNYKHLRRLSLAWQSDVFGGPVFQPVKSAQLKLGISEPESRPNYIL